jgi:hypothetical protein
VQFVLEWNINSLTLPFSVLHAILALFFIKNKKHIIGVNFINQISPRSFPGITHLSSSASQF